MARARRTTEKPTKKSTTAARKKAPAKKRIRRTPEEARSVILDAAEAELLQRGPAGLRLMEVAAAAGVSHSVIIHHFGSRGALLNAVVERALGTLRDDLLTAISTESEHEMDGAVLVDKALRVLRDRGHARLWIWLTLSDDLPPFEQTWVRDVALAAHTRCEQVMKQKLPFEDTLFKTMLAGISVFGEALIGDVMVQSAGLSGDASAPRRFREWMARFVSSWLPADSS